MPIQVINDPYRFGNPNQQQNTGILGQIGSGIGRGLTRFAENKLQQIEQRNAYTNMADRLRGAAPELTQGEAEYLATLPPQYQIPLLQALGMGKQPQQEIAQQQFQPQEMMQVGQPQQEAAQQIVKQQRPSFLQAIAQSSPSKEASALRKEEFKENLKEQKKLKEESRKTYQDILKSEKSAKDTDVHLDRMEKLVKEGSLPIAAFNKLFKKLETAHVPHIPLLEPIIQGIGSLLTSAQRAITSPDSEEFDKLRADFVRGAKDIFGSRMTEGEINLLLETYPSLDQTDAGKLQVIKNIREFNKAARIKADAARNIIKENNGIVPPNIDFLIEGKVGNKLDKIHEDIINSATRAQSRKQGPSEEKNILPQIIRPISNKIMF